MNSLVLVRHTSHFGAESLVSQGAKKILSYQKSMFFSCVLEHADHSVADLPDTETVFASLLGEQQGTLRCSDILSHLVLRGQTLSGLKGRPHSLTVEPASAAPRARQGRSIT